MEEVKEPRKAKRTGELALVAKDLKELGLAIKDLEKSALTVKDLERRKKRGRQRGLRGAGGTGEPVPAAKNPKKKREIGEPVPLAVLSLFWSDCW